jgi:hypothetical protein
VERGTLLQMLGQKRIVGNANGLQPEVLGDEVAEVVQHYVVRVSHGCGDGERTVRGPDPSGYQYDTKEKCIAPDGAPE